MKIVFTGGVSGGHFYPIIAVAQALRDLVREEKIIEPDLYFLAPSPYNKGVLFDNQITYKYVPAGKKRLYFSILNFFDKFKMGFGIIKALWTLFWIYPDVVFSKGASGSVPTVFAARILRIPIVIHDSDSAPGRANEWAGKFATKIALSYPEAAKYFPDDKQDIIAWTGQPIRKEILFRGNEGAFEFLQLDKNLPTIFIIGGSQGGQPINEAIIDALPELLPHYQIIHQTGVKNEEIVKSTADVVLGANYEFRSRYRTYGYLDDLALQMAAGAATIIITRGGSTLFEIANWGVPSIVIPVSESVRDHQHKNAYAYARGGGATVIEENNLSRGVLVAEINRLCGDKALLEQMSTKAKEFAQPDAAKKIAKGILAIGLSHE